jgi:hypothetical protein
MSYLDLPFYLAVASIGFGLSLMSYRWFARRHAWPMGKWQADHPTLPVLIGLITLVVGAGFAVSRWFDGALYAAPAIGLFGLALAILWMGFLRVASQLSLFLAPAFGAMLFIAWNFGSSALEYRTVRSEVRTVQNEIHELRQQLQDQFGLRGEAPKPRSGN